MKTLSIRLLAGAAVALCMGAAAQAKTLVYCSEGSPEGFNPSLYTAGTTFDASSKAMFNRLVEFDRGTTTIVPGLARILGGFRGRAGIHLQPAPGRQLPQQ